MDLKVEVLTWLAKHRGATKQAVIDAVAIIAKRHTKEMIEDLISNGDIINVGESRLSELFVKPEIARVLRRPSPVAVLEAISNQDLKNRVA